MGTSRTGSWSSSESSGGSGVPAAALRAVAPVACSRDILRGGAPSATKGPSHGGPPGPAEVWWGAPPVPAARLQDEVVFDRCTRSLPYLLIGRSTCTS